jgi:DNA-binding HxlR family transcriptional regulator
MQLVTNCPVAFTARILGGKWKARIVWALIRTEPLRFSAIRRAYPPVSDRILTFD